MRVFCFWPDLWFFPEPKITFLEMGSVLKKVSLAKDMYPNSDCPKSAQNRNIFMATYSF